MFPPLLIESTNCTHGAETWIARMFLQEERRLVEEADKARKEKAEKVVRRSAEEQAERDRLLGAYGYDSDPVDEDGNPLPPEECGDEEGAAVRPRKGRRYVLYGGVYFKPRSAMGIRFENCDCLPEFEVALLPS